MSFSLVGRCPRSGMLGIAIAGADLAIGSRCLHARAGTGAVLTQHFADPRLGPLGLGLIEQGKSVQEVIDALVVTARPHHGWRQLAVIDRTGRTAHFSGGEIASVHGSATRDGVIAIGSDLAAAAVTQAMVDGFAEDSRPVLAERLLRGLEAGLAAGGATATLRSAALLVVHRNPFPHIDLRVDGDPDPIATLRRLWQVFEPEADLYAVRVTAPDRVVAGRLPR